MDKFEIQIDRNANEPAYRQLYLQLREGIKKGAIPAGEKLPKIRSLANELGVARNTIEAAYRQLDLEGYAHGKRGVGFIVEKLDFSIIDAHKISPKPPLHEHKDPLGSSLGCKYDFSYGNRNYEELPLSLLRSYANEAFGETDLTGAATYIDPFGIPELRERIASRLIDEREISCMKEQIVLQPGTQSALQSIMSLFPYAERRVAMENPGYDAARAIFKERAVHITNLPAYRPGDAFVRKLAESDAKLVFLTPSSQFPLGNIMPLATRLKILEWAEQNDAYIIEDDYCCEFRYNSAPIPSMYSLGSDRVIYLGTMSKILTPSIRMTCVVLPPRLVKCWEEAHRYRFCALPWLSQEIIRLFMSRPEWTRYERATIAMYRKRHDLLISEIERVMGDKVSISGAGSGLHILLGDSLRRSEEELIALAREKDVRVYETSRYWAESARPMSNYVLVGFSRINDEDIPEGIRLLNEAWYGQSR